VRVSFVQGGGAAASAAGRVLGRNGVGCLSGVASVKVECLRREVARLWLAPPSCRSSALASTPQRVHDMSSSRQV
jgi:hypothetical protein